jgi:hypothetical protein
MGAHRGRIRQDYVHGGVVAVLVSRVCEYFPKVLEGLDCGVM